MAPFASTGGGSIKLIPVVVTPPVVWPTSSPGRAPEMVSEWSDDTPRQVSVHPAPKALAQFSAGLEGVEIDAFLSWSGTAA